MAQKNGGSAISKYSSSLVAAAATVASIYAIVGPKFEAIQAAVDRTDQRAAAIGLALDEHVRQRGHTGVLGDVSALAERFSAIQAKLDGITQRMADHIAAQTTTDERRYSEIKFIRETLMDMQRALGELKGAATQGEKR